MAGVLDPRHLEPTIRAAAQKYGVDPDYAMRVAQSEGLANPIGDNGKSHGAFQLYTGGGLGNEFINQGGDINDEPATIDYAMKRAAQGGWGPWNGAKKIGITGFMGINRNPPGDTQMASQVATPASTGDAPPPARPAPVPTAPPAGTNTLSMNSPLAGANAAPQTAAPLHSNQAINEALTNAFRPVVPDQINSLLGPAIGAIQAHTPPIAYYQPRQAPQVAIRKIS